MDLWKAISLGALQGLTEFLPVSSSAHLVIAKNILGFETGQGPFWEVAVHFGTLISILVVFRRDIFELVKITLRVARGVIAGKSRKELAEVEPRFGVVVGIIVGSVPAGVVGIVFKDGLEKLFDAPATASAMMIVTGVVLLLTARLRAGKKPQVGVPDAFLIGCAQAVAILPGISRSGSTISAALARGVDRMEAGRFSFLLAIPALAGAGLLEGRKITHLPQGELLAVIVAVVTAFLVGCVALTFLLRVVRSGKLWWFGLYCIPVGLGSLCYFLA